MSRCTNKGLSLVRDFANKYDKYIIRITVTMDVMHVPLTQSSQSILFFIVHTSCFCICSVYFCRFFVKRETTIVSGFHSGDHVMEDSQGERIVPAGVEGGTDGPGLLFGLVFGVRGELELDVGV